MDAAYIKTGKKKIGFGQPAVIGKDQKTKN
jgi:hypothetical protein